MRGERRCRNAFAGGFVRIAGVVALSAVAMVAASAKDKPAPKLAAAPKPSCARASYPGDPVCDVGDPGSDLPTPHAQTGAKAPARGMRVNDDLSIRGRSDFNADRNGPIQFNNPSPHPSLQDVNGGGAIDYRF